MAIERRSINRQRVSRTIMNVTMYRRLHASLAILLLASGALFAVRAENGRVSADGTSPTIERSEKAAPSSAANSTDTTSLATEKSETSVTAAHGERERAAKADPTSDESLFLEPQPGVLAEQVPSTFNLFARTIGSLAIVLGLIIGGTALFRRFGGSKALRTSDDLPELIVLSSVPLGRERTLALVRFGSRTLLVGSTPHAITLLTESDGDEARAPVSVAELLDADDFAAELERASATPVNPNA